MGLAFAHTRPQVSESRKWYHAVKHDYATTYLGLSPSWIRHSIDHFLKQTYSCLSIHRIKICMSNLSAITLNKSLLCSILIKGLRHPHGSSEKAQIIKRKCIFKAKDTTRGLQNESSIRRSLDVYDQSLQRTGNSGGNHRIQACSNSPNCPKSQA